MQRGYHWYRRERECLVGTHPPSRRLLSGMMEQARYNPRYLAYAAEHSRTAEEQLANDREEWPGGLMCGFILWNTARIAEYAKINPRAFFKPILNRLDLPAGRPQIKNERETGRENGCQYG